ncbi:MAG: hypothetical protein H0W14_11265 [Actinobacteria bacterium]|nr:hypothetical protein [Actinomycetota bacterium]
MTLFWLALALFVLVTGASMIIATRRGLALFRDFKRLSREVGAHLDGIARAGSEIELHLQAAATSGSALEASLARLRLSRKVLAVHTAAIADVQGSIGRITAVVPRSK